MTHTYKIVTHTYKRPAGDTLEAASGAHTRIHVEQCQVELALKARAVPNYAYKDTYKDTYLL